MPLWQGSPARKTVPQVSKGETMSVKTEWHERYGCHSIRIAPGFDLTVNWEMRSKGDAQNPDGPYEVSACGFKCKKRAQTVEEGKQLAIRFARKILTDALKSLEDVTQ